MTKTILFIEDNSMDVMLLKKAFEINGIPCNFEVVSDGDLAISRIRKNESFPHLVILDLNIPKQSGEEILREIKGSTSWKNIPVIVMTTSGLQQDICMAYAASANCYIKKPLSFKDLKVITQQINDFWLKTVTLPDCETLA